MSIAYDQSKRGGVNRIIIAWFCFCSCVFCVCLASRNWELIDNRNENRQLVNQLGFVGYAVCDLHQIALSFAEKSRINNLDTGPYRDFLAKRNQARGDSSLTQARKKNVIFLQMESVDGICLYGDFEGKPIMPNLRRIADESVSFANNYDATDAGRTVDAEFMVLTSMPPIKSDPAFVNFNLDKIPSLPRVLKKSGYYVLSMHGFGGHFWNRDEAHQSLGYDRDFFLEDFESSEKIGWGVSDGAILGHALEAVRESSQPVFAHVILLTHHHPYNHVGDVVGDRRSSIEEDYLVSLRYVDAQIGSFYDSLKASGELDNTILAIFGDHDSGITGKLALSLGIEPPVLWDTVPLVVAGLEREPRRIEDLSSLQDLPVIVLRELGIQPPITFIGNSIESIGDSITPASLRMRIENGKVVTEPASVDSNALSKLALWRPKDLGGPQ